MDWSKFNDSLNLNDSLTLMTVYATGPRYINGDNTIGDITRASNGLDPDQARHFVEPDLGQNRSVKPSLASQAINSGPDT